VGYGIGGSIVIDNQLYKGITEGAGEIGHTTIDLNGPQCSCGNYGCLQVMASEQGLINMAEEMMGFHKNPTPEFIYGLAAQNDSIAVQLVKKQAKYLGIGIANLINTFNPKLIVINGRLTNLEKLVMEEIRSVVERRSMKYLQESCNIIFSRLGEKAILKGTVALVLSETFNNIHDRGKDLTGKE